MKLTLCGAALVLAFAAPPAPQVSLNPTSLDINAPVGGPAPSPAPTITLKNTGGAKLNWTATVSASSPWLTVSPASGNGLGKSTSIDLTVSVNMSGLTAKDYVGTITVTDNDNAADSQSCTVTLHVLAAPKVDVNPASVSWTVPSGTTTTPGQPVTVKNVGGLPLTWTGSSDVTWLSSNPPNGSLGPGAFQTVTLNVDFSKQSAVGTHVGHWTPKSDQDPSAPSVTATLTISAVPVIGLAPTSLLFDVPQGSNPPPGAVTLSNNGTGTLDWKVVQDASAPWLVVSPSPNPGSLASGATQPLSFTMTSSGLAEGTYFATIQITSTTATNSPQSVNVTLNVNAAPKIGINPASLDFTVSQDHPDSSAAAVSVTNTGAGTLQWSAAGAAPWLSISPAGGELAGLASQPLLISAGAGGMAPGTYTTLLQVSGTKKSDGTPALNSPQTISISLTVGPSDKPTDAPAGQCGLLGAELLVPALLAGVFRRRASRRIRP